MAVARTAHQIGFPILLAALALLACRGGGQSPTGPTSTAAPNQTQAAPPATRAAPTEATAPPTAIPTERPAQEPMAAPLLYHTGRNDYVSEVDRTPREWLLYVPPSFDPGQPVPVVFMFHGSNQGGPLMFENTTWAEQADQHGFLVVFPTGWKYPLVDQTGRHTKWNSLNLVNQVVPGTELKDDVHFVQAMLAELQSAFELDLHRVYATGFSNGAGFVLTRLIPEMSTVFAAYATAGTGLMGGAEGEGLDAATPVYPVSLYSVLGTQDAKVAENTGYVLPMPIETEAMLADPLLGPMFTNTTRLLGLDMTYTQVIDEATGSNTLTFNTSLGGAGNQYIFRMIRNMGHVYPSGDNNRYDLDMAPQFWAFFAQYTLP